MNLSANTEGEKTIIAYAGCINIQLFFMNLHSDNIRPRAKHVNLIFQIVFFEKSLSQFLFQTMHVCMYVCMYVSIYLSVYLSLNLSIYGCMYVCMYVCMRVFFLAKINSSYKS